VNFKEATDQLFAGVSHTELAASLGVSIASIRQGRLSSSAKAHRAAPANWKDGVERLAREQIRRCEHLLAAINGPRAIEPNNEVRTAKPVRVSPRGRVLATE